MAQQRQLLARIHLDRLKQSKPLGPCFTCNGDRLKKTCPIELAKRGKVAPISMAELIDLDIFAAEDLQGVDEMIQRFGVFLEADDEFLVSKATQVAIVDLAGEESGELVARVMAELNLEEDDETGSEECRQIEVINAFEEHQRLLDIIRRRR